LFGHDGNLLQAFVDWTAQLISQKNASVGSAVSSSFLPSCGIMKS
jgi:hypothetical protein